jgi:hypothetical protein
MTESDWASATEPQMMPDFVGQSGRASDRKLRLYAAACCRLRWDVLPDGPGRTAVEVGELYADGLVGATARDTACEQLQKLKEAAIAETNFERAVRLRCAQGPVHPDIGQGVKLTPGWPKSEREAGLLRDIVGNPFRPVSLEAAWLTADVVALAQAAYDDRLLPSGHLDPQRLAILADALEEAGCAEAELLGHLRGPGPHLRGCFVIDLLLNRD